MRDGDDEYITLTKPWELPEVEYTLPADWKNTIWWKQDAAAREQEDANRKRLGEIPAPTRFRKALNELWLGPRTKPFKVAALIDAHERRLAEEAGYRELVDVELANDRDVDRLNRISALERRGVPPKDAPRLVDDSVDETEALNAARAFFASDATLLVLAGPVGTGKTVGAGWCVAHEPGGRFITAADLSRVSVYDDKEIGPLERCSLLAIDDLGADYLDVKGFAMAKLDALINGRYSHQQPTVITSNLSPDDFRTRYERISDRIRECGSFVWCGGPSLRTRKDK